MMVKIKLKSVISFSSEDPIYCASNLIKCDSYKKWKCAKSNCGQQAWVSFKLEELTQITSIDIGNENSAIIEVFVGREGVDDQVILPASSFMTPLESRNDKETNRVRMFSSEKLTKSVMEQNWDRIKVVCTQPFNKSVQFGLSFIKLYSAQKEVENTSKQFGSYTLNVNDEDKSISQGFLFSSRKNGGNDIESSPSTSVLKKEEPISIKRNLPHENITCDKKPKLEEKKHNRRESADKSSEKVINSRKEPTFKQSQLKDTDITKNKAKSEEKTPIPSSNTKNKPKEKTSNPSSNIKSNPKEKIPTAPSNTKNKNKIEKRHKPFHNLMGGVVFVMSGYKNPQRSEIRDKMIKMGARYKADWDPTCTHLICAFTNTPKFKAVRGKGKIVSEKWIEKSYKDKIRYPWRRFNLEKDKKDESEEEIFADELVSNKEEDELRSDDDENPDYEEDTDDELNRLFGNGSSKNTNSTKISNDNDAFNAETDEDEHLEKVDTSNQKFPELPSFFSNYSFYLYGYEDKKAMKIILRNIVGCGGTCEDNYNNNVHFVITDSKWTEELSMISAKCSSIKFVTSDWIFACVNQDKLLPINNYEFN